MYASKCCSVSMNYFVIGSEGSKRSNSADIYDSVRFFPPSKVLFSKLGVSFVFSFFK